MTLGNAFLDLLDDAYQRVAILGFRWIPEDEEGVQALHGILNVRLVVAADAIAELLVDEAVVLDDGGDDARRTAQGGVAASGPPGGPAALRGIGRQSAGNGFLGRVVDLCSTKRRSWVRNLRLADLEQTPD